MRMGVDPRHVGGSILSTATLNEVTLMNYPSIAPDQPTDLPSMLSGIKWFKGSAGLAVAWKLDTQSQPPTLVCTLFTRAPNDELSYVPPTSGTTTIRLSPWSGAQLFQLERQPLLGDVMQETDGNSALRTNGLIYLDALLAAPDDVPSNKGGHELLFLHVHCRLGTSGGFRTKIARGTYGQFIKPMPSLTPVETAAEKVSAPAQAISSKKQPIARKSKARSAGKRSH